MATKTQVWVQLTTGGKPYPPTLQEMFLDPMFFGMEIWPIDQPASFAALLLAAPLPGRAAARSEEALSATSRPTTHGSRVADARIQVTTFSC
jgi:hypothetical protein